MRMESSSQHGGTKKTTGYKNKNSTAGSDLTINSQERVEATGKQSLNKQLHDKESSVLQRYCQKAIGKQSVVALFLYETIITLFSNISGAAGYALRKQFYPYIFKKIGKGAIIGKGLTIRHPGKIIIKNNAAIDDYTLLDASGAGEAGIIIGANSIISRNCVVQGKTGSVEIGDHSDIGCNVIFTSASKIVLEESVLIAANCYIGGGRYFTDHLDVPIVNQGTYSRGTLRIGRGSWLGAGVTVLDGVKIGKGCIIGASSLVTRDIPDFSIAMGIPARVVSTRISKEGKCPNNKA